MEISSFGQTRFRPPSIARSRLSSSHRRSPPDSTLSVKADFMLKANHDAPSHFIPRRTPRLNNFMKVTCCSVVAAKIPPKTRKRNFTQVRPTGFEAKRSTAAWNILRQERITFAGRFLQIYLRGERTHNENLHLSDELQKRASCLASVGFASRNHLRRI